MSTWKAFNPRGRRLDPRNLRGLSRVQYCWTTYILVPMP